MDGFRQDVRYGVRMLFKNPGTSAISILALTLGIGVTATMYSIVYGIMLRLPFEESEKIISVARTIPSLGIDRTRVRIHDYLDWRAEQSSFEQLAAFRPGTVNVAGTDAPTRYEGAFITASGFRVLRQEAFMGRTFFEGEDDPTAEPVMLIGYHVWHDRFDGDLDIVGRVVRANAEPTTIVGVMPEGFQFPELQDVWLPLRVNALQIPRGQGDLLRVFGRLAEGVSLEEAQAELAAIARQLELEYPTTNEGFGVVVFPYVEDVIGGEGAALLWTMLGAVFLVLLIACANVANLLLSRAFDPTKEVAIRTALGAKRRRIMAQMLTEVGVLALIGAILGLAGANLGVGLFNRALEVWGDMPFFVDIKVDAAVVIFVLGLTFAATFLAGIFPAVQTTGGNLNDVLSDASLGSSSFRLGKISKALVVLQIALSCGLLVGAGLMIKSVANVRNIDFGFPHDEIFTASVGLFEIDYPDVESRQRFFEDLRMRLSAQPGVVAASLAESLPVQFLGRNPVPFGLEGESYAAYFDRPTAHRNLISAGFFDTFAAEILHGRDFNELDTAESLRVAIVNRAFVEKFFHDGDPLGKLVNTGWWEPEDPTAWVTIVGVVGDLYMGGPENDMPQGIYLPLSQYDAEFMSIAARTRGDPLALTSVVRGQVMGLDANLPIYDVRTMSGVIREETMLFPVMGSLFMIFGFVALFLASVGLYGVMSFAVRRRTQEIGVRMALGAGSPDVLRLILRQGLIQLGIGLVLGMMLAAGVSRLTEVLLFGVEPSDPTIFAAIAIVLLATGLLACLIPARRAASVDPMVALRSE